MTTASITHLTQKQIISITIPKIYKSTRCHLTNKLY